MLVTLLGITSDVKPVLKKAKSPMDVTLSGRVIVLRAEQELKVEAPMVVTPSGILTELKAEQAPKANDPMTPTLKSDEVYDELRLMARQYHQTVSMLIKAKITLSNLVDMVMPGINSLIKESGKLCAFMSRYIHYQNILDMRARKFFYYPLYSR